MREKKQKQKQKQKQKKKIIYIYIQRERERENILCVKKQKIMHRMREGMTNLQYEDKNKKSKK